MRSLRNLSSGCCCALILALALASFSSAADAISQAANASRVVVLRSGGVLHGQVSVSGERYVVTRPNSVVDVPAPQVLLVASSMDDAYLRQRQQLPRDTPEAHLALAEWCLRYDLVDPAKQELADARHLDPRDPRAALLERRLAVLIESKQLASKSAPETSHSDDVPNKEQRKLDDIANDLPPGAVERFTRRVQPLLVNNCTASGCHQAGGQQEFQLDRAVLHGLSNRRTTLRNLAAVMELIDRDNPKKSELLSMARRAHGGENRPMTGARHEAQLTQLADWVALVAQADITKQPAKFTPEVAAAPIAPTKPFGFAEDVAPSAFLDSSVVQASAEEPQQPMPKKSKVKFGADLRPWQPKDEFDPEAFNRLSTRQAATEVANGKESAAN